MSSDGIEHGPVRLLSASERIGGASDRGCVIAVSYIIEGEEGVEHDWLDDFIDEYCDGVKVGEDGLRRSLRPDADSQEGR